jgi:predicted  nucleic acid-binding Zn-ribbon protein
MTFPKTKLEATTSPTLGELREAMLEVSRLRREFVQAMEEEKEAMRRVLLHHGNKVQAIHARLSVLEAQIAEVTRPHAATTRTLSVPGAGKIRFTHTGAQVQPWHCIIEC